LNLDGEPGTTVNDLMPVIANYGSSLFNADGRYNSCLEGVLCYDGYVDRFDVISFEWALINNDLINLSPISRRLEYSLPLYPGEQIPQNDPNISEAFLFDDPNANSDSLSLSNLLHGLVILGKMRYEEANVSKLINEGLYFLGDGSSATGYTDLGEWPYSSFNIKLVKGLDGELYQVNIEKGICRLDSNGDRECILTPGQSYSVASQGRYHGQRGTVYVGLQYHDMEVYGRPVWDVEITSDYIYAVPVVVVPDGNEPYLAAAKFNRLGGSTLELNTLYDDPLFFDEKAQDNPDLSVLCEIEIDDQGNVYVLNTQSLNSSEVLWKYSPDGDILLEPLKLTSSKVVTDPNILHPVGLTVVNNTLYLGSGHRELYRACSEVYAYDTVNFNFVGSFTINGMDIIIDMTTGDSNNLWVVGMNVAYEYVNSKASWSEVTESFYKPRIAKISADELVLPEATVLAVPVTGDTDLGLPLSIVWVEGN
jgi:hypothetical protein